jgi:hypothetical protein
MFRVLDNGDVLLSAEANALAEHILELVTQDEQVQEYIRKQNTGWEDQDQKREVDTVQLLLLNAAIIGQP